MAELIPIGFYDYDVGKANKHMYRSVEAREQERLGHFELKARINIGNQIDDPATGDHPSKHNRDMVMAEALGSDNDFHQRFLFSYTNNHLSRWEISYKNGLGAGKLVSKDSCFTYASGEEVTTSDQWTDMPEEAKMLYGALAEDFTKARAQAPAIRDKCVQEILDAKDPKIKGTLDSHNAAQNTALGKTVTEQAAAPSQKPDDGHQQTEDVIKQQQQQQAV